MILTYKKEETDINNNIEFTQYRRSNVARFSVTEFFPINKNYKYLFAWLTSGATFKLKLTFYPNY